MRCVFSCRIPWLFLPVCQAESNHKCRRVNSYNAISWLQPNSWRAWPVLWKSCQRYVLDVIPGHAEPRLGMATTWVLSEETDYMYLNYQLEIVELQVTVFSDIMVLACRPVASLRLMVDTNTPWDTMVCVSVWPLYKLYYWLTTVCIFISWNAKNISIGDVRLLLNWCRVVVSEVRLNNFIND